MIKTVFAAGLVLIAAALAAVAPARDDDTDAAARTLSPAALLGAAGGGDFARAELPYPFRFPADHGSHRDYRTETWQLFGVLDAGERGPLGLRLAVIRIALAAAATPASPVDWASGEIYAALVSISAADGEPLHTASRLVRGGIGLAGWQSNPMRLWVEDWQVVRNAADTGTARLELRLAADGLRLELELRAGEPPIDHNSIRSETDGPSPPFIYYVEPRLQASGRLVDGEQEIDLRGTFSIEHAWGELPLPGGPVAQDRFTLYLADGRELFLLRSHRRDGAGAPTTAGLLIGTDREPLLLDGDAIELRGSDYWTSPRSGARYPLRWQLSVPQQDIDLELVATREASEGKLWSPFWSGPVRLLAVSNAAAGEGLMLLNGYHEP